MSTRELAPCGTIGAYSRHIQAKQAVDDACAQAWRDYRNEIKPVTVRVAMPRLADAACATRRGQALFADITAANLPEARAICTDCPVQRACLQWGVLYEQEGMWGGLTQEELRRERHRHGIRRQEPNSTWAIPRLSPKTLEATA